MKRLLLLLGFILVIAPASAADNVLQTIEITPVKDTYNIVLVADKAVDVKKVVDAPNKITLNLKDIRASKNLNTVYNNVSGVDTVMVEPQGKGISIFFQAENAEAASVAFDTLITPVTNSVPKNNLKLSNPIESYAPIYREDIQNEKTSNLFNMLKSKNLATPNDLLDEDASSDTANKFISFGVIVLAVVGALKLFRRKEPSMKIGLQQSLGANKNDIYKGFSPVSQISPAPEKPFTTVNYGLNAYQREERNPYETSPMQFHNPKFAGMNRMNNIPQTAMQQPVAQPMARLQSVAFNQQQTTTMTKPTSNAAINTNNPNVDNLRFLESMTKIYEKSGRHDLARGLKASLAKTVVK